MEKQLELENNYPNMALSIENKFKKIFVDSHKGNSNIKIRKSLHFPNLLGPIAIVKCGSCGNQYKKVLHTSQLIL